MSIYLHLRAVAEGELQDDHTWLAAFMSEAWEDHVAEYAAGVTWSMNKGWDAVNELWNVVGARFNARGWTGQELLDHHRELQGFYGRAASAGHAVVKAVWV
ncbi:hypothetical protein [Streptomyces narbonensis]|uniref:hypothetical protein n=1 Tax=Streptomyces narbonensis TaxID=67333 RepID=UPI001673F494|nr:hypothetical protein [Streptomyces narbonensis]GGW09700.1 hypothetical protein GCM10010230_59460 [Streptomyces narbonensis]